MNYEEAMQEISDQHHNFYNKYRQRPNSVIINRDLYKQLEEHCKELVMPRTTRHITKAMGMQIYTVLDGKELIKVCLI